MKVFELEKWVKKAIDEILKNGSSSVHLDELKENETLIGQAIEVLQKVVLQIEKTHQKNLPAWRLEVQIELIGDKNRLQGVPHSFDELCNSFQEDFPPELILTVKRIGYVEFLPNLEYYFSPLPFKINELGQEKFFIWYSEYRSKEDLYENECYERWLNITYLNDFSQ